MNSRQQYQMLMAHVGSENIVEATRLLEEKISPNNDEKASDNCLHMAARGNNLAMCQLLLRYGADLNKKNEKGHTPLETACRNKNWKIAELFIVEDKNKTMIIDHGVLRAAIEGCSASIVEMLLKRGVSPNQDRDNIDSCLHLAVKNNQAGKTNKKIVQLLIEHGADLTKQNRNKQTPIEVACLEMAEFIAELCNTDVKDNAHFGGVLLSALSRGKESVVCALLYAGASTEYYYTYAEYYYINGVYGQPVAGDKPIHLVDDSNIARLLRRFGADVLQKNNKGQTAYDKAVSKRDWALAQALAEPIFTAKQVYDYLMDYKQVPGLKFPEVSELAKDYKEPVFVYILRLPINERIPVLEKALDPKYALGNFFWQQRNFTFQSYFFKPGLDKGILKRINDELTRCWKSLQQQEELSHSEQQTLK